MGRDWRTGSSDLKNRLAALGNAAAARKNMTEEPFWHEDALHSPILPALKRNYDNSY